MFIVVVWLESSLLSFSATPEGSQYLSYQYPFLTWIMDQQALLFSNINEYTCAYLCCISRLEIWSQGGLGNPVVGLLSATLWTRIKYIRKLLYPFNDYIALLVSMRICKYSIEPLQSRCLSSKVAAIYMGFLRPHFKVKIANQSWTPYPRMAGGQVVIRIKRYCETSSLPFMTTWFPVSFECTL